MAKLGSASDSRAVNKFLAGIHNFNALTRNGGTKGQYSKVARSLASAQKAHAATPGREREARSARAFSMRAKALSNTAGRVKGGVTTARPMGGSGRFSGTNQFAAPGALRTGQTFAPNPRGGSGGGKSSGS